MAERPLPRDATALAALAGVPLSYGEVGATRGASLPPGYHHLHRERVVGHGRDAFERVTAGLLRWRVITGAGLRVAATETPLVPGSEVLQVLRLGPVELRAPCRVVYVLDEPDRRGFAYGSLAGHHERGEEAFVVAIGGDDVITFTITSFSRPATVLARLGGPVTRGVQSTYVGRYLDAAAALAAA